MNTVEEYDNSVAQCREIFLRKSQDYGTSWRVYRMITVADQIYIKAKRIRTIQENKIQRVGDDILSEFRGIYNYAIIGLFQLKTGTETVEDLPVDELEILYNSEYKNAKELMLNKNHDYGEAWRDMGQESFTDLILAKILRIKQIISNGGKTLISEGIDANLYDIMNYSVFALIMSKK